MKKIFLGGTKNNSLWREDFKKLLDGKNYNFVEDENEEKNTCDFFIYILTPKHNNYFPIADVVDNSNKRTDITILCILQNDGDTIYTKFQTKSMNAVRKMVKNNGASVFSDLEAVVDFLERK